MAETEKELLLRVAGELDAAKVRPTWEPLPFGAIVLYGEELSTISRVLREAAEGCEEGHGLPIDTAPEDGTFLAFNPRLGEFCEVQRYDHPDGSKNCVINARMGRWWRTDLWYPLPPPPATEIDPSGEEK